MLYCINHRISLPANAHKRLQKVGDDGVALVIGERPH
jgi:hypothetical protein